MPSRRKETKKDEKGFRITDQQAKQLHSLVHTSVRQAANNPLKMLLYVDETTAGNPLNPVAPKKSHMIYISAMEFTTGLGMEEFWLTAGIILADKVQRIPGGLLHVMKSILLHWTTVGTGILQENGFAVVIQREPILVRFNCMP